MKRMRPVVLLVLILATFGPLVVTQAQDETPASYGLQVYDGGTFWFMVPANAHLEAVSDTELQITGPDIAIRPADADFTIQGPAYQINVTIYENPEALPVDQWAQQQILSDWQAAMSQGAPNTFPVTDDGIIDENKFRVVNVGSLPAARADYFGGDATIVQMYTGSGSTIVMFRYREEILPNNPLATVQQDVYALIMNTLHFVEPAG
jgi:hypothetical protein